MESVIAERPAVRCIAWLDALASTGYLIGTLLKLVLLICPHAVWSRHVPWHMLR